MYAKPSSLTKLYIQLAYGMHRYCAPQISIFHYQITNLSMVPQLPIMELENLE